MVELESTQIQKRHSTFQNGLALPFGASLAKDSERLLGKTKKRKIKENIISDESVGVYKPSFEFDKGPTTQKRKDGERWLVKAKKRKIKKNRTSDESIGACESSFVHENKPKIQKGKDGDRLFVKAKKRKIKGNRTFDESIRASEYPSEHEKGLKTQNGRLKKSCKHKKHLTHVKESNTEEVPPVVDEETVDEISSVDDDCTRGMKKWLTQYKECRPGLKVLQQKIDEFVTAHEERLEQERKEREARAAGDGWTVVAHQKGRKKTTDAETGTVVGSVATSAVLDKLSKKKSKEIALHFYRFQKREAKRNEVMMLQSKFEQDKKRIQQLRAARKFRPS